MKISDEIVYLNSLENDEALFLLRIFVGKIYEILTTFCRGSYVMPNNPELNNYYTSLLFLTDGILKRKNFKALKSKRPELYESILGDKEIMDLSWELVKGNIESFVSAIEKEYIKACSPEFELKNKVAILLKDTDAAVENHKKIWGGFMQNVTRYWVKFPQTREVIVNNRYLLAKPDLMSENDTVFNYVYEHPNKILTTAEIENATKHTIKKKLSQIIKDLGFTEELRKLFFNVSNKGILFRNPISENQFKELNIDELKLKKQLDAVKNIKMSRK